MFGAAGGSGTVRSGRPYAIAIFAGDNQSNIEVGTEAPIDPEVIVTLAGVAAPNVYVAFISSDDGLVGLGPSAVVQTDINGHAVAPGWIVGSLAGQSLLRANVMGTRAEVVFNATTVVTTVGKVITYQSVQDQTGLINTAVTTNPAVLVEDTLGNPLAGETVVFAPSAGSSGTGLSAVSDANGIATVGSWTLGGTPGQYSMTATLSGATNSPLTFTASAAQPVLPARLTKVSGDNQSGVAVGTASGTPCIVCVDDGTGAVGSAPVQGVRCRATITAGGGSFAGQPTIDVFSDASGNASFSPLLGTVAGVINTFDVVALDNGGVQIGATRTFHITSVAGAATKLGFSTAPPSGVTSGVAFSASIQLQDQYDNAVSTASVSIAVTKLSGAATLSGTSPVVTNGSGISAFSLTLTGAAGNNVLRFTSVGLTSLDSNNITIGGQAATHLKMIVEPSDVDTGAVISPSPQVGVYDDSEVLVTASSAVITAGATDLGGVLSVPAVNGISTFPGLSVSAAAAAKTIDFTSPPLIHIVSAPFDVTDPPPAGSHPFEPGGMTQITLIDDCNFPSIEGNWGTNGNSHLSVIPKFGTGCRALTNVLKLVYGSTPIGSAPITTWKNPSPNVMEWYVHMQYRWASTYRGHQSKVNKIIFNTGPTNGGGCPFILNYTAVGFGSGKISVNLQSCVPNFAGNDSSGVQPEFIGQTTIPRDAWIDIVYLARLNDNQVANGRVEIWLAIDGGTFIKQNLINSTGNIMALAFRGTAPGGSTTLAMSATQKVGNLKWSPTLGGAGAFPDGTTHGVGEVYMSYFYASGKTT